MPFFYLCKITLCLLTLCEVLCLDPTVGATTAPETGTERGHRGMMTVTESGPGNNIVYLDQTTL